MQPQHKKILKSISLELRHLLEGYYDSAGDWHPGDLEQRLAAIGVRRDREPVSVDELTHLSDDDKNARKVVDAYLQLRAEAGVSRADAVAEFVRETAYTWANRLICLRCMEARELIDEVILQKEAYGGRSLEHHRLVQRQPELCSGEDDGLIALLDKVFTEQAEALPLLFDPQAPGVALKPSPAVLKRCLALLSGTESVRGQDPATAEVFQAPDALGWAYQYWNTEEKDRVFEKVRTQKGAKIAGADIIPATQLYTEPYMVKFLVENSLGATWMGMHPESKLYEKWEYYVRDADRADVKRNSFRSEADQSEDASGGKNQANEIPLADQERNEFRFTKPVSQITFLDPACGSGHFLLEAFDLFYDMYVEEGELTDAEAICRSILEKNLYGIDIDARAVQIAEAALWMKAAERAFGFRGSAGNLVAAVASHLKGELWEEFLAGFQQEPSIARVLRKFGQAMEHIDELGSLARPEEELRAIIHEEHAGWERQVREKKEANYLFAEMTEDALSGHLPFQEISDEEFGERLLYRVEKALEAFSGRAQHENREERWLLSRETQCGLQWFHILRRKYDVVAANPPYIGSNNMGKVLKDYVARHYPEGKRDAFASFLLRAHEELKPRGYVSMVTQQGWMFLSSFERLRRNLIEDDVILSLAHLGRYAFSDITNAVVAPVLVNIQVGRGLRPTSIRSYRLTAPRESTEQGRLLREAVAGKLPSIAHKIGQNELKAIPGQPLLYWLRGNLLQFFHSSRTLANEAHIKKGIDTGCNQRFLRFWWEVLDTTRWSEYAKGGGYARWYGFRHWSVDWRGNGAALFSTSAATPRNLGFMGRSGLTYTVAARGSLGVRVMHEGTIFDSKSAAIFPYASEPLLGLLNSRVISFFMRCITPSLDFNPGYLARLVIPQKPLGHLGPVAGYCVSVKDMLSKLDPTERTADPVGILASELGDKMLWLATFLHTAEGVNEALAISAYELNDTDIATVLEETGRPAGLYPLIGGYTDLPALPDTTRMLPEQVKEFLSRHDCIVLSDAELEQMKRRIQIAFEGTSLQETGTEIEADNEGDDELTIGASIPVPSETLLEVVARQAEIHPISAYWLLKEGIEHRGWRCLPLQQQITSRIVTVTILSLLGHRWPCEGKSRERLAGWADPDGIIPLTEGTGEPTLAECLRKTEFIPFAHGQNGDSQDDGAGAVRRDLDGESGLRADGEENGMNSVLRDFAEIMGKPLEQWLVAEFFKHHTSQFKKRPIAWQIQSGKFTAKKKPAFACLVYYHKLDGDLLPKIRTQYVGPLRQRMETELRGIESTPADARSDRQEKRRVELESQIDELRGFDAALQKVINEGFASKELEKIVGVGGRGSGAGEALDQWCSLDGRRAAPETLQAMLQQESRYFPDINDGVRVNIAPLQKAGLLAADVLSKKDVDKAIADRAQWRADERRWCREGKLPQPGWWADASEDLP